MNHRYVKMSFVFEDAANDVSPYLPVLDWKDHLEKPAVLPFLSTYDLSSRKWFAVVLRLTPVVEQYFSLNYPLGLSLQHASVVSSLVIFYCYIDSKYALVGDESDSSAYFVWSSSYIFIVNCLHSLPAYPAQAFNTRISL